MKLNKIKAIARHEIKTSGKKLEKALCINENILRNKATETRWNQYEKGVISHSQLVEFTAERIRKQTAKQLAEKLSFIDQLEQSEGVKALTLSVDWRRSAMWGLNPHCIAHVVTDSGKFYQFEGTASGCGYDKLSASVADALYQCKELRSMLCEAKERKVRKLALSDISEANRNYLPYGAGYGAVPYLESGVGISSTLSVLGAVGLVVVASSHTKTSDFYHLEKGGKK